MDLNQLTSALGGAYDTWKQSEKLKNSLRDEFFQNATERARSNALGQVVEYVRATDEHDARTRLERLFPTYEILDVVPEKDQWKGLLQECPEYREFTFVNEADGRVYQRQIVLGSPLLDDERLKDEQPALWLLVSQLSDEYLKVRNAISFYTDYYHDESDADYLAESICKELSLEIRVLRPLEELSSEELAGIQEYIYYSKPMVKLAAPRQVKAEDLGT